MKPQPIPQRSSLVSQTIALLERGMKEGRWAAQLPSQSELCRHFAISRTTLRLALQALQRRGKIQVSQGCPAIILRRSHVGVKAPPISRAMVGSAVAMLVWSKAPRNMPSISPDRMITVCR